MTKTNLSRREFVGKATAGGIATALTASEVFADEKAESSINKPKNVLFLWGGWEGHDPGLCKDIFVPCLKQSGFDVVVTDTLDSYIDKDGGHHPSISDNPFIVLHSRVGLTWWGGK